MAVRTKRTLCVSLCVLVWSIAFLAGPAVAAKCPYCGRKYPEPAPWPGEKERIKALREAHERTCPKRPKGRPEVPDKRDIEEFLRGGDIQVLRAARSFPDGGGYEGPPWKGHGVPEDVKLNKGDRRPIRRADPKKGTYCCGFTFAVVMKAARNKGLLVGKPRVAAERFAREWYGATAASAEKQVALAMQNFGIGGEVQPQIRDIRHKALRPGDFVMFWRRNKSGHSVVFLDWVRNGEGKIIGMKYRSSQGSTKGIGDAVEYFESPPGKHRRRLIDPRRAYAGRLHRPDGLPGAPRRRQSGLPPALDPKR